MDFTFLSFEHIQQVSPDLKEKFIDQATKANLKQILTKYKKSFRLSFHKTTIDNVYLVMVVGNGDDILIQLANECNFPRGFPVLWIPDQSMQYFGFYPKFDNDDRQMLDDTTEFDDIIALRFFKKFSGFLGQLISFEINGKWYWTVTSKNSADCTSEFVQDGKRIFEPYVTYQLVQTMIQDKIHICAEVMSENDQTHGTRVFKECPVVTCVGQSAEDQFVKYFDHMTLVNFCTKFKLPCDSAIIIDTPIEAQNFMKLVSTSRDFMVDDKLDQIIQETKSIKKHQGTIDHTSILGNCLEGIVLRLTHQDGRQTTKKYKFPNYTIRTMLIREQLNNFKMTNALKRITKGFTEHWCVTEEGKKYWYRFGLQAFYAYDYDHHMKFEPNVGKHIQLAESIKPLDNIEEIFDHHLAKISNGTILIICGPIGSGKTSMMNLFQTADSKKYQVIDGDLLDMPNMQTVLMMGRERADYSRWLVIKALMEGKVPVISAGGGIFFGQGKSQNFELVDQIYKTLGIIVKVIFLLPTADAQVKPLDKTYDPVVLYNDQPLVIEAVTRRVQSGEWGMDPKFGKNIKGFANFIYTKSQANHKFALKLIQEANEVYGFPMITSKNYGIQDKFDLTQILNGIQETKPIILGNFHQIRILTQVDSDVIGHITWMFGDEIKYSLDDFAVLKTMYPDETSGVRMSFKNNKNEMSLALPLDTIHEDGSTHITIDSGSHEPKEMKRVALAIKKSDKQITLPVKNSGQSVTYDLTADQKPCQIKILGVFGI